VIAEYGTPNVHQQAFCFNASRIANPGELFPPGLVQVGLLDANAVGQVWAPFPSSAAIRSSRTTFLRAQSWPQSDARWHESVWSHAGWASYHNIRCARIARNASSATTTHLRRDIRRSRCQWESLQDRALRVVSKCSPRVWSRCSMHTQKRSSTSRHSRILTSRKCCLIVAQPVSMSCREVGKPGSVY
jgi:hypothetical protein